MKRFLTILAVVIIISAALAAFFWRGALMAWFEDIYPHTKIFGVGVYRQNSLPRPQNFNELNKTLPQANDNPNLAPSFSNELNESQKESVKESQNSNTALPLEFNLAVPFTSQAPFGDWSAKFEQGCEETSMIMVDAFYKGREFSKESATEEILALEDWEQRVLGFWEDTTAEETARILREKYGYENVKVVYDMKIDDIKREVAQGRPVILPAAGQLLGNKYFRQPGPLYHMLVVRGWTRDGMIITNDPGTKRGEGYLYKPEILMNAIHDWNRGDVYNGRKVMIVVGN